MRLSFDRIMSVFSCSVLTDTFERLDLYGFGRLAYFFHAAQSFNGDVSAWIISHVTSLAGTFSSATVFNRDVSLWETSRVVDLTSAFQSANSFDFDLSKWNTERVTLMDHLFQVCLFDYPSTRVGLVAIIRELKDLHRED